MRIVAPKSWTLAGLLLALPVYAAAGPDLPGAARALLMTPPRVAGDLLAGAGLLASSGVGLAGDSVALLDDNRLTRPLTRGVVSRALGYTAFGTAWLATRSAELLRAEDIGRLPQPAAAWVRTAFGAGRMSGAGSGLGGLWLALRDAVGGPLEALLRAGGARAAGDAVARNMSASRVRVLGPDALETGPP